MSWNNIIPAWLLDEKGKNMNDKNKPMAEQPVVETDDMDIPEFLKRTEAEMAKEAKAPEAAEGTDTQPA